MPWQKVLLNSRQPLAPCPLQHFQLAARAAEAHIVRLFQHSAATAPCTCRVIVRARISALCSHSWAPASPRAARPPQAASRVRQRAVLKCGCGRLPLLGPCALQLVNRTARNARHASAAQTVIGRQVAQDELVGHPAAAKGAARVAHAAAAAAAAAAMGVA